MTTMHCQHGFKKNGWLACASCRPEEAKMQQGDGGTISEIVTIAARRKASASLGIQQPSRVLDLDGKTLAGCIVGKMAVNATANTRFHCVMLCGHPQITDGTMLMAAERAGKTLKCSRCSKIDGKAARKAKIAAKREARHG